MSPFTAAYSRIRTNTDGTFSVYGLPGRTYRQLNHAKAAARAAEARGYGSRVERLRARAAVSIAAPSAVVLPSADDDFTSLDFAMVA
jgi:hypothetical protein